MSVGPVFECHITLGYHTGILPTMKMYNNGIFVKRGDKTKMQFNLISTKNITKSNM